MRSIRPIRVLTVVSLAIALLIVPVVTHAAPRFEPDDSGSSLLVRAWDWVSSLWGAGGGGFDPTTRSAAAPAPAPVSAPTADGEGSSEARSTLQNAASSRGRWRG